MTCPRCGATVAADLNFCTSCGYDLRAPAANAPATTPPEVERRLRRCPVCGASNAASRRWCGRCQAPLEPDRGPDGEPDDGAENGAVADDAETLAAPSERETPAMLVLLFLVAGMVILGVLMTLLNARGVGWFAGPPAEPEPGEPVPVPVVAVRASSSLPASGDVTYDPENLTDGDPTTAWNEAAAGSGEGEWVELILEDAVPVGRVLVWNGYQKGAQFRDNARVATVDIDIGERTLTADLLDIPGPQAIDFPEPIPADRLRLTIRRTYEGRRYTDAALSEIEVHAMLDAAPGPVDPEPAP
jgi:hypothetical protein